MWGCRHFGPDYISLKHRLLKTVYKYCHAYSISNISTKCKKFESVASPIRTNRIIMYMKTCTSTFMSGIKSKGSYCQNGLTKYARTCTVEKLN